MIQPVGSEVKQGRNYGVECLRIISMYFIVVIHVLGQGGILNNLQPLSIKYDAMYLLEGFVYCAVNCFAIISGYGMSMSKPKYNKLISLWLQVLFYSVMLTVIVAIFMHGSVTKGDILKAFFPLLSDRYWYFTSYFVLYLCTPILNRVINELTKEYYIALLTGMGLLFVLFSPVFGNYRGLCDGYSFGWLIVLYFVGGYIRKYPIDNISPRKALIGYIVCVLGTGGGKIAIECITSTIGNFKSGNRLISYLSPTVVGSSIALTILFACLRVKPNKRLLRVSSQLSFSVYLIHTNLVVFNNVLKDAFLRFVECPVPVLLVIVLVSAGAIYLFCLLLDLLRLKLFESIGVDEFSLKLYEKIKRIFSKISRLEE